MSLGMERHGTMQQLKQGSFPNQFCERIGDTSGKVQGLIGEMLSQRHCNVTDVKLQVMSLIA